MNRVIESALSLALITGFLYALSIANHNAYLFTVGVEEGFITRNSHQILYNALFVILIPVLQTIFWVFIAFAFLYLGVVVFDSYLRSSFSAKRKLVRIRRIWAKISAISKPEAALLKGFKKFLVFTAICTFIFVSLLYAERQGKNSALKFLDNVEKSDFDNYRLISFEGYESSVVVISCGTNNCAGLDTQSKDVIYFQNNFTLSTTSNILNPNPPE
jgi:hypothetical protein